MDEHNHACLIGELNCSECITHQLQRCPDVRALGIDGCLQVCNDMLLPLQLLLPLCQSSLQLTVGHTQRICLRFQTLAPMLQTSDVFD